jgi:hypothetical protein
MRGSALDQVVIEAGVYSERHRIRQNAKMAIASWPNSARATFSSSPSSTGAAATC